MKRAVFALWILWTASTVLADRERRDLSGLAWLEGEWRGVTDGAEIEEHWTSPAGGGLVGMHKEVRNGKMVAFEFLRIVKLDESPEGAVGYVSSPNGVAPTTFKLTELGERRVVFANPTHDFPQRILYWLGSDGSLHARIDGVVGGKSEAMEWIWRRR